MVQSIYPVLMTEKLQESCEFYKRILGFSETFSSGWYVSLLHPDGNELALIDARHETIPESCRGAVRGMILNIEVDDAARMYREITERNDIPVLLALRDEDFGQRHFMVQDPNDIIVDVIEVIPPSEEFQAHYQNGEMQ